MEMVSIINKIEGSCHYFNELVPISPVHSKSVKDVRRGSSGDRGLRSQP
jgi:hypothetical protein